MQRFFSMQAWDVLSMFSKSLCIRVPAKWLACKWLKFTFKPLKGNLQWITTKFLPACGSFMWFMFRKHRLVEFTKEMFTSTNSDHVTLFIYKHPSKIQIYEIKLHLRNYRITVASLIWSITKIIVELRSSRKLRSIAGSSYFLPMRLCQIWFVNWRVWIWNQFPPASQQMTLYCPLWNGSEKYKFIKLAFHSMQKCC